VVSFLGIIGAGIQLVVGIKLIAVEDKLPHWFSSNETNSLI